ncbi:DUF6173 family protein [Rhizobium sp. BR 315]|uniref:DUF6173 family protein n=1 Tax=Rhizobium sp. BR 315 TaxID=3040014 RepID=UPI003D344D02
MDIDNLLKSMQLSSPLTGRSPHDLNPASWMYERIVRSIIAFEEKLDPELEIGARLVSFASSEIIHIDDVGYWGPDIIKFYGKNADGHPVELIQHMSQLSVLLVAVKPLAEPRRIGFALQTKLEAKSEDVADGE